MKHALFLVFLCLGLVSTGKSQSVVKDSSLSIPMIGVSAGLNLPTQELQQRFRHFAQVGGMFQWKTTKNWMWSADAHFLFGKKVNDTTMLDGLLTENRFLIGADGTLYDVRFLMRGFSAQVRAGRMLMTGWPNRNSGLYAQAGLGFLQHKIRLEYERNAPIPALAGEYYKGYDRLSNGLSTSLSAGYLFLSNQRLVNFFVAVDYQAAFTKNRRSWNYDTNSADTHLRSDGYFSVRLGWIIPMYRRVVQDYYYF